MLIRPKAAIPLSPDSPFKEATRHSPPSRHSPAIPLNLATLPSPVTLRARPAKGSQLHNPAPIPLRVRIPLKEATPRSLVRIPLKADTLLSPDTLKARLHKGNTRRAHLIKRGSR